MRGLAGEWRVADKPAVGWRRSRKAHSGFARRPAGYVIRDAFFPYREMRNLRARRDMRICRLEKRG
jgi:hypothetical protein